MKTKLNNFLHFALLLSLFTYSVLSQASLSSSFQSHSNAHLLQSKTQVKAGDSVWVMVHLELQPQWHTYWLNPGDSGLPIQIGMDLPSGIEQGPLLDLPPRAIKVGGLTDYGYSDHGYFLFELKTSIESSGVQTIPVTLEWLTCKSICVPQSGQFELQFTIHDTNNVETGFADLIEEKRENAINYPTIAMDSAIVDNQLVFDASELDFEIEHVFIAQPGITENQAPNQASNDQYTLPLLQENASSLSGFILSTDGRYYRFKSFIEATAQSSSPMGFWMAIAFGLLGGLILNIMPCVFPILTLKVLSLTKLNQLPLKERSLHGLFYTAGICLAFVGLACVIVGLKSTGEMVGWGFQMQSPVFLISMSFILFLVACNLMGWFEFIIPMGLNAKGHPEHKLRSSFMTGLLITLVATPCTAPFMAPAIGYTLTQPVYTIFSVFLALGIGLASPFVLLTIVSSLSQWLPKPGPWLNTFKQLLAFPMFLSVVWVLWVLMRLSTPSVTGLVLIGLVALGFMLWLNQQVQYRFKGLALGLLFIGFTWLANPSIEPEVEISSAQGMDALNQALEANQRVLVNVTADWCITCKVNERLVFQDPQVQAFFEQEKVKFITLDWTQASPEITQYLQSFGRAGVPLYVYYEQGEPVILPQVLTKTILKNQIQDRHSF